MVLVPAETVERLRHSPVSKDPMEELHSELNNILSSHNMSDSEKWKRYQQVLERCLRHAEQRRKPFSFSLDTSQQSEAPEGVEENNFTHKLNQLVAHRVRTASFQEPESHQGVESSSDEAGGGPSTGASILETVPKTYKSKASVLLQRLLESKEIKWDKEGRVMIKNNLIQGSNISDLINDALRKRKSARKPDGFAEFYKFLSRINVPNELIGNDDRWNLIRGYASEQASSSSPHFDTLWPETPRKRPKTTVTHSVNVKKVPRKKLDWERFVFDKK